MPLTMVHNRRTVMEHVPESCPIIEIELVFSLWATGDG